MAGARRWDEMNVARWSIALSSIAWIGCGGAAGTSGPTAKANRAGAGHERMANRSGDDATAPGPVAPVQRRGGKQMTVAVGRGGATLELDNGARIVIPAGTLRQATDVVFMQAKPTTAFSNYDDQTPLGPTLQLSPEMQAPAGSKIVLSVPLSQMPDGYTGNDVEVAHEELDERQRAYGDQSTVTRWHYGDAGLRAGRLYAEFDYVSGMRLQFVASREDYY